MEVLEDFKPASLGEDATKLGNRTFAAKLRRNKFKKSTRKRKDSEDPAPRAGLTAEGVWIVSTRLARRHVCGHGFVIGQSSA